MLNRHITIARFAAKEHSTIIHNSIVVDGVFWFIAIRRHVRLVEDSDAASTQHVSPIRRPSRARFSPSFARCGIFQRQYSFKARHRRGVDLCGPLSASRAPSSYGRRARRGRQRLWYTSFARRRVTKFSALVMRHCDSVCVLAHQRIVSRRYGVLGSIFRHDQHALDRLHQRHV